MATVPATIEKLKQQTVADHPAGSVHAQVDEVTTKRTKDQKPYLEIQLRDATASFPLRVWSDHHSFGFCSELRAGDFVQIEGDFMVRAAFGVHARNRIVLPPERTVVPLPLLHLVASCRGEKEFAAPVEPKTTEAMALHLIDNLDA